jgi:hypothetical protein
MVGGGGREFGKAVGAGRGEWNAGGADEGKGDWVGGHAETDGGEAGGDDGRNDRRLFEVLFQDQGQRAGPESTGQAVSDFWPVPYQGLRHFDRSYVDDERAGGGSAFDGVNAGYGFGVEGVGS